MDTRVFHKMVGDGRRPNVEGLIDKSNVQSHANAGHVEKPLAVVAEVNVGLDSLGEKATGEEIPTASTDTQPTGDPTAVGTSMGAKPGPPREEHHGMITPIRTANGQRRLKNGTYRTVARAQGYQPEVESALPTPSAEYAKNAFDYLSKSEDTMDGMSNKYLESASGEVTAKTRRVLVDSLIETHTDFGLDSEVLFMSIHIMDFVSYGWNNLTTAVFRLIGMVALLVSTKAEETKRKSRLELTRALRQSIIKIHQDKNEVNAMEEKIMMTEGLRVYFPTTLRFLEHLQKNYKGEAVERTGEMVLRAKCFAEIGLFDPELIGVRPLKIAKACLLRSVKSMNPLQTYEQIAGNFDFDYCEGEMEVVICALEDTVKFVMGNKMFPAVNKKYPFTAEELFGPKLITHRDTDEGRDKDQKMSAEESTRSRYCTVL